VSEAPRIGIVGASGAVGAECARLLAKSGEVRLRLGARRPERIARGLTEDVQALEVQDTPALERFCAGCRVVINAAGPSYELLDRVARAALAVGAESVDPGGDEPLLACLADAGVAEQGRRAIVTAGMMPGLSGLIPRWLAQTGFDEPRRLVAYVGGRDPLTPASARDYLASLGATRKGSLAAWRDGRCEARALTALTQVELPFFPGRVSAFPFLGPETERLAQALGLREVDWYNVLAGKHIGAALARSQGAMSGQGDLGAAATALAAAAELDLCDGPAYQLMVVRLAGLRAGRERQVTLVLRARDAYTLTANVATLAALAVLRAEIPVGVHLASEALSPRLVERARRFEAVELFECIEGDVVSGASEEGEL
jgi:hypothetical protein